MHKVFATTIAAVALLAGAASQANAQVQTEELIEQAPDRPVIVHVDNGNWLDVRVYAVRNGNIYDRIGTVNSYTSREFEMPSWVTASNDYLQLVVVPIGSRQRYTAPPVMVSAGDTVEWRLGGNLANSTIAVRAGWEGR